MWRAWRPCSGSLSTYPLVMIGVVENISYSEAKMFRSTIMHVQYSFSYNSYVDMDIFSCFGT
jgi:hypothetical protein